jgi:hypothetical protein
VHPLAGHLAAGRHGGLGPCKAGKCGSCSVEINGKPRLSCMTRMNVFVADETITVQPVKTFPAIKDLVTHVSWKYRQNCRIRPFKPKPQEFRKCIECYLSQDVRVSKTIRRSASADGSGPDILPRRKSGASGGRERAVWRPPPLGWLQRSRRWSAAAREKRPGPGSCSDPSLTEFPLSRHPSRTISIG